MALLKRIVTIAALATIICLAGCGGPKPAPTSSVKPTSSINTAVYPSSREKLVYSVAAHWNDVRRYYHYNGSSETKEWGAKDPVPAPTLCPNGIDSVRVPVIAAHPARDGKGRAGETILRFSTTLPTEPTEFVFGPYLTKSTGPSDGVQFAVKVNDTELFSELVNVYDPTNRTVDLSRYAGQAVTFDLITDPGPGGNPQADWARWAHPRIRVKQ